MRSVERYLSSSLLSAAGKADQMPGRLKNQVTHVRLVDRPFHRPMSLGLDTISEYGRMYEEKGFHRYPPETR